MQVFLQIVAFSLQTDGSGRPVLTKGKRPKTFPLRPTFNREALRAVKRFSYMKIPPKLKFIQSDRYDKQFEFP